VTATPDWDAEGEHDDTDVESVAHEIVEGELVDAGVGPRPDQVTASDLLGRVISDDVSPSFERIRFRVQPTEAVSPGEFVTIEAHDRVGALTSWVLCRVLDVHEVNPHEDPLSSNVREVLPFRSQYSREGESTVIYRLAECEPIEELAALHDEDVGSPSEVTTLPMAGALVRRPRPDVVTTAMGFPPDPDEGLQVGNLHGMSNIPVVVDKVAVQRHIGIVGGIGSGKSYTRGVLGEELHRLGVPQVNIDVNGEMIKAARQLGGENLIPGKGFTLPLSSFTQGDLVESIPGVQKGTQYEILIGYAFDVLQREMRQGRRSSFTVADLVQKIEEEGPNLEMKQNTIRPAKVRAGALDRKPYIGAQLNWQERLRPGAFINIDCRSLLLGDLRVVTAAVARDLQTLARMKKIPFAVLSIDEFHLVAPNDDKLVSTQVLREIARIGRHYKLGLILTTQSPADVDRSVLKRLLTRFVHTIEPDQLDALRGIFADAPPEMIKMLPKLRQGTCVLTGVAETVRHASLIDIRSRITDHGGATPDVWSDLRRRGWASKKPLEDIITEAAEDADDDPEESSGGWDAI
jgi:uncharacterized protein